MAERDPRVVADIATYGWHVINVLEESDSPPFSYSIGLFETAGHPEIILVGLPREVAHPVINIVGEAARDGRRFEVGSTYDDFLEGYDCTFRAVPQRQYRCYLGQATRHYSGSDFPVLQLIFPDRSGRWPWDPSATEDFRGQQPVLADAPEPPWADA